MSAVDQKDTNTTKAPRGWKVPVATLAIASVFLLGALTLLYPSTASWFAQYNQSKTIGMISSEISQDEPDWLQAELDKAREYNQQLVGGALLSPASNVPTSDGRQGNSQSYDELLKVSDDGLMGRLRIPAINVDLPIYHGTDAATLEHGVGHLEGTALPVGGISQHSVLTAHRGLPDATLFNDLPKLKIGDTFTIEVLGEVLSYQVTETQTVLPDETKSLVPQYGKDLATLVTCTPLGINSHRMLVTAERILPTPIEDLNSLGKAPDIPGFPWWSVFAGAVVLAAAAWVYFAGRDPNLKRP